MRIGAAALEVGVATHVLRHWEDLGVVVPDRLASGYRHYTAEHVHRLRVVQACQRAGLSLREIRLVLDRGAAGRREVIEGRLRDVRAQRADLAATESFLGHVLECRHDLMSRCPGCRRVGDSARGPVAVTDHAPG